MYIGDITDANKILHIQFDNMKYVDSSYLC